MDEIKAFFDTLNFNVEDVELVVRILFQVLLLVSSAVFSGSETALFSLSRIDLQKLRQSRHADSESIHAMLDEPRRLIISILCGNELVNIASAVNMTGILLLVFPHEEARQLLLVLGILGVITGELAAYQARDITRMLGWSSVGQLGVVFIAFSLPGKAGLIAGVTVAMHHLVVKSALFLLADRWGGAIARLKGAASSSRPGAAMFVLFSLSLLGLPPLPGFWSKFLVLGGLADAGSTLQLAAMAIILAGTVLEGAYLMRVITTLYKPVDAKAMPQRQHPGNLFASAMFAAVLLCSAVMVNPLWQGLNAMAESGVDTKGYIETVFDGKEIPR